MKTNKLLRNKFCRFWAWFFCCEISRKLEKAAIQTRYATKLKKTMPKYEIITIK